MCREIKTKACTAVALFALLAGAAATFLPSPGRAQAMTEIPEDTLEPNTETAAAGPAVIKSKRRLQMELLAQTLPKHTVHWLEAGDREFLALYQPAFSKDPHGTVLMLHGAGEHPAWPGLLSDLRNYLAHVDWSTLSIALPNPDLPKPPPAIPAPPRNTATDGGTIMAEPDDNEGYAEAHSSAENEEIFDDSTNTIGDGSYTPPPEAQHEDVPPGMAEEVSVDRVIAAIDFLREINNKPIILYGQGLGAARAGEFLYQHGDPEQTIKALILINAQNNVPSTEFSLLQALNDPNLPILDLMRRQSAQTVLDAEARRQHYYRQGFKSFRHTAIAATTGANESLLKNIHGFLTREIEKTSTEKFFNQLPHR